MSWKTLHTHLLNSDMEPITGQSMDTNKVHLGETMSFIGIIIRSMGKGSRAEEEMTQRQLCHESPRQYV